MYNYIISIYLWGVKCCPTKCPDMHGITTCTDTKPYSASSTVAVVTLESSVGIPGCTQGIQLFKALALRSRIAQIPLSKLFISFYIPEDLLT